MELCNSQKKRPSASTVIVNLCQNLLALLSQNVENAAHNKSQLAKFLSAKFKEFA